jgi:hypothetical protein
MINIGFVHESVNYLFIMMNFLMIEVQNKSFSNQFTFDFYINRN